MNPNIARVIQIVMAVAIIAIAFAVPIAIVTGQIK